MQTFLPSPSFMESAQVLDYRRLGKQRVECKQILQALGKTSGGWVNHPATKMWRGHEWALASYAAQVCVEWRARGYKDSLLPYFTDIMDRLEEDGVDPRDPRTLPHWLGNEELHASHRGNLLRKDFVFYSKYNWTESPEMPYIWPTV